jgi:hypothetical protein
MKRVPGLNPKPYNEPLHDNLPPMSVAIVANHSAKPLIQLHGGPGKARTFDPLIKSQLFRSLRTPPVAISCQMPKIGFVRGLLGRTAFSSTSPHVAIT